jgi:hypothetical protein
MTTKTPETDKAKTPKKTPDVVHPGMMGDGTQEQGLSEPGKPDARIKEDELKAAFGQTPPKVPPKKAP